MIFQHRPLAVRAFQKQFRQPARKFIGDFIDGDEIPRSRSGIRL